MNASLYLLDARNAFERRWLLDRLRERAEDGACADLPVLRRGSWRGLAALAQRVSVGDGTLVQPLRVAWRIPHFARRRGLRKTDFLFGDPRQPGAWRARWILRRDPARAECVRGQPATLGELRQRFESQVDRSLAGDASFAAFVARQATLALDVEERAIQGGRYKVPRFVTESIVASPLFASGVEKLAGELGRPVASVLEAVNSCLREMVSSPSPFLLDLRRWLDQRLWLRGYDPDIRIEREEFERLRRTMREHPTLLLFTHKAYGDAALPGLLCFENDLPMLHTFGGSNLDLPVFGALMRRSGGIFIRRSFQGDPVYKFALRSYVAYLLDKRFPMSWALEGTRSRLGKLMPPRLGLLKYTLDAARDAGIENLHVVPFVTSFELIRDVEEFVAEQSGASKRPESFGWLLAYARGARSPLGRVRVDLGEPVVVRQPPAADDELGVARIAFESAVQANRATPLTVTGVMCLVLLGLSPRGATAPELAKFVQVIAAWARARSIRLGDELSEPDPAFFLARLDALASAGLLLRYDEARSVIYSVDPARHREAGYYRNTVVHHFVPKSFVELALARALEDEGAELEPAFWREADRLRELFKFEFFYPARDTWRAQLEDELGRADPRWREHLAGDRAAAHRLERRLQPFLAHAVLLPYAEAYSVVIDQLARLQPGEQLDEDRSVALALREGREAWLLRRVTTEASLGKGLFANGYRLAANLGLAPDTTGPIAARRRDLLLELQALVRRMEKLRLAAVTRAEEVMTMEVEQ